MHFKCISQRKCVLACETKTTSNHLNCSELCIISYEIIFRVFFFLLFHVCVKGSIFEFVWFVHTKKNRCIYFPKTKRKTISVFVVELPLEISECIEAIEFVELVVDREFMEMLWYQMKFHAFSFQNHKNKLLRTNDCWTTKE